jgi:hypothetical protein
LALRCPASRAWPAACALIAAAAGATSAAWLAGQLEASAAVAGGAASLVALAAGLGGRALAGRAHEHEITWDGEHWHVDGVPGGLEVMLDGGRALMLLRLRPLAGGRARWLALAAPGRGAACATGGVAGWRALRAALYSPPPPATLAATPAEPRLHASDRAAD